LNNRIILAGIITFVLFLILRYTYDSPLFESFDENMQLLVGGNRFIGIFHYLGEMKFIIFITLVLLLWLWLKLHHYRGMLLVILTIPMVFLLNQLVKRWVEHPRPEIENQLKTFSFSSGHAMLGILYLLTIAYLLSERTHDEKKKWWYWIGAIFIAFFVGLSRVAESRHFATDVIAGWCLGITCLCICIYWYKHKEKGHTGMKR